jgi:hypothetical protein
MWPLNSVSATVAVSSGATDPGNDGVDGDLTGNDGASTDRVGADGVGTDCATAQAAVPAMRTTVTRTMVDAPTVRMRDFLRLR